MSPSLSVTKEVLAKLLAGENLTVVHDSKIKTAMFDTQARVLMLPIWEVMDGWLYDLLTGHECGHALHTPAKEWGAAIDAHPKNRTFKDCMNVIEDARIEKKIKRTYPGLNKSFSIGYRDLFNRDFFGVLELKDYSKLNIIDRINLYFKVGSFVILPFSDEERAIVRDITDAETFAQVLDLTERVMKIAKKEEKEKEKQIANLDDLTEELLKQFSDKLPADSDDSSDDSGEPSESKSEKKADKSDAGDDKDGADAKDGKEKSKEKGKGKSGDKPDKSDEKGEGAGKEKSKEKGKEKSKSNSGSTEGGEDSGDSSNDIESVTDRNFRQHQEELVQEGMEIHTYSFPKPKLENIIVPANVVTERFFACLTSANPKGVPMVKTCVDKFNRINKRYIAMLIKEFEMRKNARQFARTTTARTGELDMGKLSQYKFNNDIFRKISVVQKGKSHGIIMYLDMSSSMTSVFGPTMEQTLILASFCKRIGIPFDVYGFSDDSTYLRTLLMGTKIHKGFNGVKFQKMPKENYAINSEGGFHLKHLISSTSTPSQYRASFEMLAVVSMNFKNKSFPYIRMDWSSNGFSLSGTPFVQTLMASRPMIENFKSKHQVDICNVIYLTDGEGCAAFTFNDVKNDFDKVTGKKISHKIYFVDQKTKQKVKLEQFGGHQAKITQFVRQLTGCKHIGFYLAQDYAITSKLEQQVRASTSADAEVLKNSFKANEYFSCPSIGYDIYYYMRSRNANIEDTELTLGRDMTNNKIAAAFTEAQESKKRNRALVSSLAQEFAA